MEKIKNPILSGFNPDPCIIRVQDTFYIVNSTFEWFPGVRLHSSKDLIHWRQLESPLKNKTQLDINGVPASCGVWAPDLSFYDNRFWLVYSVVRNKNKSFTDLTNYLITASNIEGPWSKPIKLNGVGFDASLFHDSDGKKYLVQQTNDYREHRIPFNGITITEFDVKTMRLLPQTARKLFDGTDVKMIEGPHLYKIDGLYYLFAAQGGTTYTHQEIVARSKTLRSGSFEIEPKGPFLTNYDTPDFEIQKQGHGSLVKSTNDKWYYASLSARPWHHDYESSYGPRGWSTLGRETSLQQVVWDDKGWPRIVGGHAGQLEIEAPENIESAKELKNTDFIVSDEFSKNTLNKDWSTLRIPFDHHMGSVGNGKLKLIGQNSLTSTFDVSLVARRWEHFNFDATVGVNYSPETYQQMAGLFNLYNNMHWTGIVISWDEIKGKVIDVVNFNEKYCSRLGKDLIDIPNKSEKVFFRTRIRKSVYTYEYSFDGQYWNATGVEFDAAELSDEYIQKNYSGGFFTGAFVGLGSIDCSGNEKEAQFTSFEYREVLV
ncbi:glycoside hydrolase family 43 protein [Levilactobacillus sp. N40-8-2]|uniref:glycoside hydrolase family 43 protein n=1 Tax=Levilactobacillus muriae TaxID=3238987 RepID=UPI0038B2E716